MFGNSILFQQRGFWRQEKANFSIDPHHNQGRQYVPESVEVAARYHTASPILLESRFVCEVLELVQGDDHRRNCM